MIVPIKGADAHTEEHLDALVSSALDGQVEYLFAMESADDPAYVVCQRVIARHPDRAIRVVITGPAGARMGKQHNLAVALSKARYEAIGSMDADVLAGPDTLAVALRALNTPSAGVAYFLPCYQGPGPAGGALVALYANYYFAPNFGSMAIATHQPVIIGSLWLTTKTTLTKIGGLDQFGTTVSDDGAIGKAVARVGLRNVLLPHTVKIPYEPLRLGGGARHLLKWLAMLRAEGLLTYLLIVFTWHPILWGVLALVGTTFAGSVPQPILFDYQMLAGSAIIIRVGSAFALDHWVYHQRSGFRPMLLIPYELVAVPILFAIGLFRRSIVWRGRRYRIGLHGAILASFPAGASQE
jgi:ceramide glucosyltransferase